MADSGQTPDTAKRGNSDDSGGQSKKAKTGDQCFSVLVGKRAKSRTLNAALAFALAQLHGNKIVRHISAGPVLYVAEDAMEKDVTSLLQQIDFPFQVEPVADSGAPKISFPIEGALLKHLEAFSDGKPVSSEDVKAEHYWIFDIQAGNASSSFFPSVLLIRLFSLLSNKLPSGNLRKSQGDITKTSSPRDSSVCSSPGNPLPQRTPP